MCIFIHVNSIVQSYLVYPNTSVPKRILGGFQLNVRIIETRNNEANIVCLECSHTKACGLLKKWDYRRTDRGDTIVSLMSRGVAL